MLQLARALADETRLALLSALLDADSTVSDLADRLTLPQPRVSSHLAILRAAHLVSAFDRGRQRLYRVDAERAGLLLAALEAASIDSAPKRRPRGEPAHANRASLRRARTCYDHLGGHAGVELLDALLQRGFLMEIRDGRARSEFQLTTAGETLLSARGVEIADARRAKRLFACGCLDWTERRAHLGGALGAALLATLQHDGLATLHPGSRVVEMCGSIPAWLDEVFYAGIQAWVDQSRDDDEQSAIGDAGDFGDSLEVNQ